LHIPSRVKKLSGRSIERRVQDGRGQGEGAEYKPWLYVTDVPSYGTSAIETSWKNGRGCHLLSQVERNYFLLLEWADAVVDIREQYPLLPLASTLRIAKSLGFSHPPQNREPEVMTTDFMLTVRCGDDLIPVARTVKRKVDLKTSRLFEKLEIERRYWEERAVDWGIVTDADLPGAPCRNIDWIHECKNIDKLEPLTLNEVKRIARFLCRQVKTSPTIIPALFGAGSDEQLNLQPGNSLKVSRFLLANKVWLVDMATLIETDKPLRIRINSSNSAWS
jgi:hypothetical protein